MATMNTVELNPVFARPLSQDDEEILVEIDKTFAEKIGLEPFLSRSSLHFYVRTGHAFVSVRSGRATGFVLAQSVWNGTRPTVYVNRLAVANLEDHESRLALLEAVTKSAYDAAVYDLHVQHPSADVQGLAALAEKQYLEKPFRIFERVLGSRGRKSAGDSVRSSDGSRGAGE
jgi:Protein of unknown function (DUF1999)